MPADLRLIPAAGLGLSFALLASTAQAECPSGDAIFSAGKSHGSVRTQEPSSGQLPNGLRYVLVPTANEPGAVTLGLIVEAGSASEMANQYEAAHSLEHALIASFSKGGKRHPAAALIPDPTWEFLENRFATTSEDQTRFSITVPSKWRCAGLGFIRQIAQGANLSDTEIETQKKVAAAEARQNYLPDDYREVLNQAWGRRRPPLLDHLRRIQQLRPSAVRTFYARWYRPNRQIIYVTGDFEIAAMKAAIETSFGELAGSSEKVVPSSPPTDFKSFVVSSHTASLMKAHLQFAGGLAAPDSTRGHVLRALLRRILVARAETLGGLSYRLLSFSADPQLPNGTEDRLEASFVTAPDLLLDALQAVARLIGSLKHEPVSARELDEAIESVRPNLPSSGGGLVLEDRLAKARNGPSGPQTAEVHFAAVLASLTLNDVRNAFESSTRSGITRFAISGPPLASRHWTTNRAERVLAEARMRPTAELSKRTSAGGVQCDLGARRPGHLATEPKLFVLTNGVRVHLTRDSSQDCIRAELGTLNDALPASLAAKAKSLGALIRRSSLNRELNSRNDVPSVGVDWGDDARNVYVEGQKIESVVAALDEAIRNPELITPDARKQALIDAWVTEDAWRISNDQRIGEAVAFYLDYGEFPLWPVPKDFARFPTDGEVRRIWSHRFGNPDQIAIHFFGNFDEDSLLTHVNAVLGHPPGRLAEAPVRKRPKPGLYWLQYGDGTAAALELRIVVSGKVDHRLQLVSRATGRILNTRIASRLRDQEGASYSPAAWITSDADLDRLTLAISFVCDPADANRLVNVVEQEISRLQLNGLDEVELSRLLALNERAATTAAIGQPPLEAASLDGTQRASTDGEPHALKASEIISLMRRFDLSELIIVNFARDPPTLGMWNAGQ